MRFPWQKPEPISMGQFLEEFVATYGALIPDEKPREITAEFIEWEKPDGTTHKLMLGKIIDGVARLEKSNPHLRRELYERFIRALFSGEAVPQTFNREEYASRLLPNLRERGYLDHVSRQMGRNVPHRALNEELIVSYVIDFPDKMVHVLEAQAQELELDEAGLFELAMKNLSEKMSPQEFRATFTAQENVAKLHCPDGHAAARLLLVREYLETGVEIAALVPDGALLLLLPPPPDNNWNPLRKLTSESNATGFSRPFRVRAGEIELM